MLPARRLEALFSSPIPSVRVGINAVVVKTFAAHVTSQVLEAKRTQQDFTPQNTLPNFVGGGIGQSLCSLLAPGVPTESPVSSVGEAWQYVKENSDDKQGRVRVLVSDEFHCFDIADNDREAELVLAPGSSLVKLPLGFASHLGEPKLIELVNASLSIMEENGEIDKLIDWRLTHFRHAGIIDPMTQAT